MEPLQGGNEYYIAPVLLYPKFGYYIDNDNITVVNGTKVSTGGFDDSFIIKVTAEHDWTAEKTYNPEPTIDSTGGFMAISVKHQHAMNQRKQR